MPQRGHEPRRGLTPSPAATRYVLYPLLGLLLGAVIGAVGGFVGGAFLYEWLDPSCFEGSCGLAGVGIGVGGMFLLGLGGALFGFWRAVKATPASG